MYYPPKIKLDNGHEYSIEPEVYATIVEFLTDALLCYWCARPYTPLRPRVAENTCLECLRKRYDIKHLRHLGASKVEGLDETHKFIDVEGNIYISHTTSDHKPEEYKSETLMYWGYKLPEKAIVDGKEIDLYPHYWQIHGDVMTHSALCIEYIEQYGARHVAVFLVYKDREPMQINKRMKLYQEGKAAFEATKDPRGYYHWKDREIPGFYDTFIWEIVSDLASTAYNAQNKPE